VQHCFTNNAQYGGAVVSSVHHILRKYRWCLQQPGSSCSCSFSYPLSLYIDLQLLILGEAIKRWDEFPIQWLDVGSIWLPEVVATIKLLGELPGGKSTS
jgi:hypothetical protein